MTKIFISHASEDQKIIEYFREIILCLGLSIDINDIFCASLPGTKIKSGKDWRDYIKKRLESAKITFLIITPNYKESEICQNEMGASWVLSSEVIPMIIEPVNYENVGVLQEPKQLEKLNNDESLDRIRDIVQTIMKSNPPSDNWTKQKTSFLLKLKSHLATYPFNTPLDRHTFENALRKIKELEATCTTLIEEKEILEKKIEDLKEAKDKKEVEEIENRYTSNDGYEQFLKLCENARISLSKVNSVTQHCIFSELAGIDNIDTDYPPDEFRNAMERKLIGDQGKPRKKSTMIADIYEKISDLDDFIAKQKLNKDFKNKYNEEYNASLEIDNLDFWEEVLGTNISF